MKLQLPTLKGYLFSLIIIFFVFALFYTLMGSIDAFNLSPVLALLLGLFVGQLIGSIKIETSHSNSLSKSKSDAGTQTIYIGNLPFRTTRAELSDLFLPYGKVLSTRIMIDKATRKPRGYGFVEMDSKSAARAINKLNGTNFIGRNIKVSEANQRD